MEIKIYSRDGCAHCTKIKKQLEFYGLTFTEHKIGEDITRDAFIARFPGHNRLPVIECEWGVFSDPQLSKLLFEYKADFGKPLLLEESVEHYHGA